LVLVDNIQAVVYIPDDLSFGSFDGTMPFQ